MKVLFRNNGVATLVSCCRTAYIFWKHLHKTLTNCHPPCLWPVLHLTFIPRSSLIQIFIIIK